MLRVQVKRFAHISIYTGIKFFAIATNFLLLPLLARQLGSDGYGLLMYTVSITGLITPLFLLGIEANITKSIILEKEKPEVILGSGLVLRVSFSIVFIFLYIAVIGFLPFFNQTFVHKQLILILLAGNLFSIFQLFENYLLSYEKKTALICINLLSVLISLTLKILCITRFASISNYICILALDWPIKSLIYLLYFQLSKMLNWLEYSWPYSMYLIKRCFPLLVSLSITSFLQSFDKLLIGLFVSIESVGVYYTSTALIFMSFTVGNMLINFYLNRLIDSNEDYNSSLEKLSDFGRKILFCSLINFLVVFVFLPGIVILLFGSKFAESAVIIRILSLSIPFGYWFSYRKKILIVLGEEKMVLVYSLLGSIIMYSSAMILSPTYKSIGIAASLVISYFASSVLLPILFRSINELKILRASIVGILPHVLR